jgi:hypothetical protein
MRTLTHLLTPSQRQQLGRLRLSPGAVTHLRTFLDSHRVPIPTAPALDQIIAESVAGFLCSTYFTQSAWFRRQTVHAVATLQFTRGAETHIASCHVVCSTSGNVIVAPSEHPLPEDYYPQRLMEEVRIDCGVSETSEQPKGRLA